MPGVVLVRSWSAWRCNLTGASAWQSLTSRDPAEPCRSWTIAAQSGALEEFVEGALIDDHIVRCGWAGSDPLYLAYHDQEWGVPLRDDRALFEMLILEGFQAGLSWITILRKRANFRRAFDRFEPDQVAAYDERKVAALLADPGIVRNRAKIEGAIGSARAYLQLMETPGGASEFLWQFVGGAPIVNRRRSLAEVPVETAEARAMSRELKKRGFKFCGPTICYAFMQAVGMVDDHVVDCFRHGAGATARRAG
jgi:DNA-3-methyladenine glycosylase I